MTASAPAGSRRERRIYVVCPGGRTATGGMARMVDYMMTEWEAAGRRPAMRCVDTTGPYVKWRQPLYFSWALATLTWALLCRRVEAVHVHTAEGGSVLRKGAVVYLAGCFRRPVVVHMHGAEFAEFYARMPAGMQRAIRRAFRRADRVLVLGTAWRDYYIGTVGLDPARVQVLHNAVPTPPAIVEPPLGEPCRLLFAGALIARKGLAELFAALGELRHLQWRLVIAGNGDAAGWRAQAAAQGIAERVEILGWVASPELHRRLAACDVVVLPAHNEGLPMILIEAMAHGRPVVATRVGSIADAVDDGITGLLVPPKAVAPLAAALAELIGAPQRRATLGEAGRARYLRGFAITPYNDTLQHVFASVRR